MVYLCFKCDIELKNDLVEIIAFMFEMDFFLKYVIIKFIWWGSFPRCIYTQTGRQTVVMYSDSVFLTMCRIPFRTIVVSLLSHQVLLQNLYDILLEEFVKQPEGNERVTPVTSDPRRPTAGFLRYISMSNLAMILDLLLDSYRLLQHKKVK